MAIVCEHGLTKYILATALEPQPCEHESTAAAILTALQLVHVCTYFIYMYYTILIREIKFRYWELLKLIPYTHKS